MRWLPLVALLASSPALADASKPVRLTGKLDGTTARISARYAIKLEAGRWFSPTMRLALPRHGMVTSGRATFGGVAHELDLVEAGGAVTKFNALAADPVVPGAKTNAVLIEGGPDGVSVAVAAARTGTLFVDLEIAVPTCFFRDVRYLARPNDWGAIAGTTRVTASDAQLEQVCGGTGEHAKTWVGFARPLSKRPHGSRIDVTGARVDLDAEAIVRIELDLARLLADVPRDLATVLVVDGSRSMDETERRAQRDIVHAYLKSVPGSRVQLVSFARSAKSLLPGWRTAKQSRAAIEAALKALVPENGSNFDAGLAEASGWLTRIQGTKRIVLLTDERMAARLEKTPHDALKKLLPPGTLVHVVVPSSQPGTWYRDDTEKLAGFAAATEGMRLRGGPAEDDKTLDATNLVRPTSLDLLKIEAPGWTQLPRADGEVACDDEHDFGEGAACTWWGQNKRTAARPIAISGKLWGKVFTRVVTPTLARAKDVARELSTHSGAPNELTSAISDQARAVNYKWSLYAAWGGPGTYSVLGGGMGLGATCGCGGPAGMGIGHGSQFGTLGGVKPQIDLRTQLADQLATCNLGRERVAVEVELTRAEITDVHVTTTSAPLGRCVAEVVWSSAPVITDLKPYQVMKFVAGD